MNKRNRNAILFSLLAFLGFAGIGHFYLGKFKQGFIFLVISGVLRFWLVFTATISVFVDDLDFNTIYNFYEEHTLLGVTILLAITMGHILYIIKKESK